MSLFGLSESAHNTNQRHQEQRHERHKWLKHRAQNLSSRTIFFVLIILFTLPSIVSYAIAPASVEKDATWWSGFLQNFGTEMAGAIATFFLFELITGSQTDKKNLFRLVRGEDKLARDNALRELSASDWLRGADLSGVNLSGADLSYADLGGANLYGAYATQSNAYVTLIDANLRSANLVGANLPDADLSGADLRRGDLSDTNLSGANLSDANLASAKLSGANLTGAYLLSVNLSKADLRGANLGGAFLTDALLDETTILPDGTHYNPERGLAQLERFTHPPKNNDTPQPEQPPD